MDFAKVFPRLTKPLSLGSYGSEVKILQQALNDWDDDNTQSDVVVDGRFGKRTHYAVRFVQFWEKLKEDGVVGPKTAEVLGLQMGTSAGVLPVTISIERPPPKAMTPPLKVLIDVVVEGLRPLKERIEDAILSAPTGNVRVSLLRRDYANRSFDDLAGDLASWSEKLPEGNLAVTQLRTAFQNFIRSMKSELEAAQFNARGGWIWRFEPLLDQIPVDTVVSASDRVLRGEQIAVMAITQIQMAFENFNRTLQQAPRMDANGVGPDGKPSLT